MSSDHDEDLEKILFELPNHDFGAESMWARPLGEDLFEVRNIPFHAYGVNFLDVVEASSDSPDHKPVAHRIVRESGCRRSVSWASRSKARPTASSRSTSIP